jgi:hypothetical protein
MATALLVLNVKNPVGLGLKVDGTVREAMKSLDDNHNRVTEMGFLELPWLSMSLVSASSGKRPTTWALRSMIPLSVPFSSHSLARSGMLSSPSSTLSRRLQR